MRCSKCGSGNPAGKKFCGDCGAPLMNRCFQCGADNLPGKRFCGDCGAALAPRDAAEPSPGFSRTKLESPITVEQRVTGFSPSTSAIDGERKTVTALFADIKGSTDLMEGLDP